MALPGVEAIEVQLRQFHLGAVHDGKAHADEDVLQLVQGNVHGMLMAQGHRLAGDGHVQSLIPQAALQSSGLQLFGAGLQGVLQGGADIIGQLAHDGALLRGELAHHFQHAGKLALFAQVFDPQGVQPRGVRRALKGGEGLGTDLCQLFFHVKTP